MAKRLEEQLYHSAQTKEEYVDRSMLKRRLQLIVPGLDEIHQSTPPGSVPNATLRNDNRQVESSPEMNVPSDADAHHHPHQPCLVIQGNHHHRNPSQQGVGMSRMGRCNGENGLVLYSVTSEVTSGLRLYPGSSQDLELRVT
jgi:hypothetical protein